MSMIPIAMLTTLVRGATAGLSRTQIRTHGGEVREAGESDDPVVPGVDHVTTIELERLALAIRRSKCRTR